LQRFQVSTRGQPPVEVSAGNWLTALGLGLDALGAVDRLDRLACEVLPNHTVIARDARSGTGFVVVPLGSAAERSHETESGPVGFAAAHVPEEVEAAAEGVTDFGREEDTETAATQERATGTQHPAIAEASTEDEAWGAAVDVLLQHIDAESASGLRLASDGALTFVVARGPRAAVLEGQRLDSGAGFAGFCVARCMALAVERADRDPRFHAAVDRSTGYTTRSVLCVPVRGDGAGALGCLELLNSPETFSSVDRARAEEVASALSARLVARVG